MKIRNFLLPFLGFMCAIGLRAQVGTQFTFESTNADGKTITSLDYEVMTQPADGVNGTVKIVLRPNPNASSSYTGAIEVPATVSHGGKNYDVTTVGRRAFSAAKITSIRLNRAKYLENSSFEFFSKSASIEFAEETVVGPYAFSHSTIEEIDLKKVKETQNGAFYNSRSLKKVNLRQVERIKGCLANACPQLTQIIVERSTPPAMIEDYGYAFDGMEVPSGTTITVTIPNGSIAAYRAAEGWSTYFENPQFKFVEDVSTPQGDVFIVDGGVKYRVLSDTESEKTAEVIGDEQPYSGQITIPETVQGYQVISIGAGAFKKCPTLTGLVLTAAQPIAVDAAAFDAAAFVNVTVQVPEGQIETYRQAEGWQSFYKFADGKTTVDATTFLYEGVQYHAYKAEGDVIELEVVALPDGKKYQGETGLLNYVPFSGQQCSVTRIADRAFADCADLKVLDMGDIPVVGSQAFAGCSNLIRLITHLTSGNALTVADDAFTGLNLSQITLQVPTDHIADFQAVAPWSGMNLTDQRLQTIENFEVGGLWYEQISPYIQEVKVIARPDGVKYSGEVEVPDEVTAPDGRSFRVTVIGNSAFYDCTALTEITFGQNVEKVEPFAFNWCKQLQYVDFANIKQAEGVSFALCYALRTVQLRNVETLTGDVFLSSIGLQTLQLSTATPPAMGSNCFEDTDLSKVNVVVPAGAKAAYAEDVNWKVFVPRIYEVPTGVFVYDGVWYKPLNDTEVEVTTVPEGWNYPQNVHIPASFTENGKTYTVKKIGDQAFANQSQLQNLHVPAVAPTLSATAFEGLNLGNILLHVDATAIGYREGGWEAFNDIVLHQSGVGYRLHSTAEVYAEVIGGNPDAEGHLTFPATLSWEGQTYPVTHIANQAFAGLDDLVSLDLNQVENIGECAFQYCANLRQIDFGKVRNINSCVFFNCPKLEIVDLKNVEKVGSDAFSDCSALKDVYLNQVNSINHNAFANCPNITYIKTTAADVPTMTADAFNAEVMSKAILQVPEGAKEKYLADNSWNKFAADHIIEFDGVQPGEYPILVTAEPGVFTLNGNLVEGKYAAAKKEGKNVVKAAPFLVMTSVVLDGQPLMVEPDGTYCFDNAQLLKTSLTVTAKRVGISLDDKTPYTGAEAGSWQKVIYTRNYAQANVWYPLYLPFALQYDDWKDNFDIARLNDVHQFDDNEDGIVDRTALEVIKLTQGATEANMMYMIRAKQAGQQTLITAPEGGVTLEAVPVQHTQIDCSSVGTLYTFTGIYEPQTLNGAYVVASDGSMGILDEGQQLGGYRWYLTITDRKGNVQTNARRIYVVEGGDDLTGIEVVEKAEPQCFNIYDLNGRLVKANATSTEGLARGIYIVNGKKIMK